MTNKDKYKLAFSAIHPSEDLILEVMKEMKKHRSVRPMTAALAAVILLLGCATAAYAADIGGIQKTIRIWICGDQTEANLTINTDATYRIEYVDSSGETQNMIGGGSRAAEDGSERPLTEEEIMERLTAPRVCYLEDGSVWVYWYDQEIEITDRFENEVCYLQLVNGDETLYLTIKYKGGFAAHPDRYVDPQQFYIGK